MAHDIDPADEAPASPEMAEDASRGGMELSGGRFTYLVTAYRWGQTNQHAYHVYAGPDQTKAIALAKAENSDRGGKYGVVVWEFEPDGVEYKRIFYLGSSMDSECSDGPHHNYRIDYFERLGMFVDEAMSGKALCPNPEKPHTLSYQTVEALPAFLLLEIERQKQFYNAMAKHFEERGAAGTA